MTEHKSVEGHLNLEEMDCACGWAPVYWHRVGGRDVDSEPHEFDYNLHLQKVLSEAGFLTS